MQVIFITTILTAIALIGLAIALYQRKKERRTKTH